MRSFNASSSPGVRHSREEDKAHRDVARHIALSMDLARNIGINGTPSFVIGDRVKRGLIPLNELFLYVREARAAKVDK